MRKIKFYTTHGREKTFEYELLNMIILEKHKAVVFRDMTNIFGEPCRVVANFSSRSEMHQSMCSVSQSINNLDWYSEIIVENFIEEEEKGENNE